MYFSQGLCHLQVHVGARNGLLPIFKLKCVTQPNNFSKFIFQVSDTGVGMDKESLETVFDSFNQMRKNHKRQFGGIGLGLNIAKHLVDLFEGTILTNLDPFNEYEMETVRECCQRVQLALPLTEEVAAGGF